uniref:VWFA domain-containing protein n=2 Tax=Parascaris univalens TaxID=6257 RepID=A0A915AP81_PARUN
MFDYEEQMPCSCKKTVCLITSITIVVLVTVFVVLMSVFIPRRYSPPIQVPPVESQKLITFAFTIASYRGTSTARENKSTIIRRVIEGFNSTEIIFAFELDDGKAVAIRQYNKNNSIAALEWLLQFQFINQNPNQNKMVTVYKEAISKNTHILHSYVFFAALQDDYRNYIDFISDTRNTIGSIASLKNTNNNSNKAMLIAPSEVIDIIYENDLCVIDINKIRNEQAIDAIITYISSRGDQCPLEINRPSSSTGTKLPSEPSESTPSTTLFKPSSTSLRPSFSSFTSLALPSSSSSLVTTETTTAQTAVIGTTSETTTTTAILTHTDTTPNNTHFFPTPFPIPSIAFITTSGAESTTIKTTYSNETHIQPRTNIPLLHQIEEKTNGNN